ncbi:MAG: hypothetical protein H6667_25990 [Ardenticatenaceae bacterium]|nr:hypothetical protein [Ardenticatenaceae bacterium]
MRVTSQESPNQPEIRQVSPNPLGRTIDYIQGYMARVRSGEIGSLPIILGLIVIVIIFQSQNQNFLTARNFVNLIVQMAGYTVIAIGVVYVLLIGEIDLSIGYVSAVSAVFMTLQLQEPNGWPWYTAVTISLILAAGIGIFHGLIITRFRVPSFIVSLAALLAWNGAVLILIGSAGTVIIQDKIVVGIASYFLPPRWGWITAVVTSGIFAFNQLLQWHTYRKHNITGRPGLIVLLQIGFMAAICFGVVIVANQDRGVPFVGVLLLILLAGFTFLATKTKFGRYVYAMGDNESDPPCPTH